MLFLVLLVSGFQGISQTSVIGSISELSDQYRVERSKGSITDLYSDIEGSPFLNEEFIRGEIVMNDTLLYREVPLRYNIYTDVMEFQNASGQVLELVIPEGSCIFKLGGSVFSILDYYGLDNEKRGILELLADGHLKLYKQYLVDFKPATKAIGYQDAQPNRFVRQEDEYLLATGEGRPEVFRNAKGLMEKLEQICPDIGRYSKDHKLKPGREGDLVRIIRECNNSIEE